jgi:hypothetical protein
VCDQAALEHFDPEKSGVLTCAALEEGLRSLKLETLTGDEAQRLFDRYAHHTVM